MSARTADRLLAYGVDLSKASVSGLSSGAFMTAQFHFGSFEKANGGTLPLKDIADLDLRLQARLLSALEHQSFLRVGGATQSM